MPRSAVIFICSYGSRATRPSRRKIEDALAAKRREVAELEAAIAAARVYVTALEDALRLLPEDAATHKPPRRPRLRPGSDIAKAREAILKAGKPLHVDEILAAIGKEIKYKNKV